MSGYLKDSSRKQPVLSRGTVVSPVSRFGQSGDKTPGDCPLTRCVLSTSGVAKRGVRRRADRRTAKGGLVGVGCRLREPMDRMARRQARPAGCWAGQTLLGEPAEAELPAVGAVFLRATGFVPGAVPPRCLERREQECKADAGACSGGARQTPNPLALRSLQRIAARFDAAARRRALLRKRHDPWHRGNARLHLKVVYCHIFSIRRMPHILADWSFWRSRNRRAS